MKQKILIIVSLFMACVGMQAQTEKFYLGVTDKDGKTVAGTIYDDFTFEITTPAAGTALNSKQATINVRMTNVPSLKIEGTHSATKTFTTTVDKNAVFSEYLSALYFTGTINNPVTVAEVGEFEYPLTPGNTIGKKDFTYTITGDHGTITGEPNSAAAAQAAWDFLTATSHMTASSKSDADTYLYLKQNAYVQLGDERHIFNLPEGYKFMKGNFELNLEKVREGEDASIIQKVTPAPSTVAESYLFSVYLPAGSEIAIGTKFVTLTKDCMIYVDASKIPGEPEFIEGRITQFRNDLEDESKNILLTSIELINELLGYAVEAGADELPVVVEFKTEPMALVYYAGTSTAKDVTTKTWATVQAQYPNAVAYVYEANTNHDALAEWAQTQTNVVVEYAAGKKGMYYECPEFVLTDRKSGSTVNFYTPYNFVAVTGSYKRSIPTLTSTCCLPFAINSDVVNYEKFTGKVLTFSYYMNQGSNSRYAYFNDRRTQGIDAGTPCFLYNGGNTAISFEATFDNTEIVANPDNSSNMQGTFVQAKLNGSDLYGLNNAGTGLSKLSTSAKTGVFRSALSLAYTDAFNNGANQSGAKPSELNIAIVDEFGETTSINGASIVDEGSSNGNLMTISGVKVNKASQPGIYIKNGKKIIIK